MGQRQTIDLFGVQDGDTGALQALATNNGVTTEIPLTALGTSWTPTLSTTADNTATVAATIAKMAAGDTLQLPMGTYRCDITTTKRIVINGMAKAAYAAGALFGGTILVGAITISDAIGAEVRNLSIQQTTLTPASYPNGITAGLSTTSSTTKLDQKVINVSVLGRGYSGGTQNSQHGILVQNGRGCLIEQCFAAKYLNLFVARASGVTVKNSEGLDSEANVVLFKSATAGGANDAYDNLALNVTGKASADGYFANFTILAEDGSNRVSINNKIAFCTADATGTTTGQAVFSAVGSGSAAGHRGSLFIGCTSKGDRAGNAFLVNDNFCDNVVFIGSNAEDFGGLSARSNVTTMTQLPSFIGGAAWRSGFADLVNASGLWATFECNGRSFDPAQGRTFAQLIASPFSTMRDFCTNSSVTAFGAVLAGGGSSFVPVYSDAAGVWRVG